MEIFVYLAKAKGMTTHYCNAYRVMEGIQARGNIQAIEYHKELLIEILNSPHDHNALARSKSPLTRLLSRSASIFRSRTC